VEASTTLQRTKYRKVIAWIVILVVIFLALGVLVFMGLQAIIDDYITHEEVLRITSPGDSSLDAVLIEVSGGATISYNRYAVFVLPKGVASPEREDEPILNLIGPTGGDFPYGVNLRWQSPAHLRVEYFKIRWGHGRFGTIRVNEQPVQVDVVAGVGVPDVAAD